MLVGLGLRAFAALIAAFGVGMLELAAQFELVQVISAIHAAVILGAANFVIAAILFALFAAAARPPKARELELATEIQGTSIEALQLDARAAIGAVRNDPQSVEQRPALLVPLITNIIKV